MSASWDSRQGTDRRPPRRAHIRDPHRTMSPEEQRARGAEALRRGQPVSRPSAGRGGRATSGLNPYGTGGGAMGGYSAQDRLRDVGQGVAEAGRELAGRGLGASRASRFGGRGAGGRRPRRLRPKRVILGTLAVVLALLVAFAVNVTMRMGDGIDDATRSALTPALPGQPFYMLLVGSDKSADRVASGDTGGTFRTDSIILARVDPIAAKVTLVSIQRDTKVDLDGYGTQKINAAYTLGGPSLLIREVSQLAGVPIAHYAELDFDSFVSVVDAIGGIDVNIPMDLDDDLAHLHVKAGQQTIDGDTALALCRARHAYDAYGSGDYFRTANQRMVLGAILKKGLSGNPVTMFATINAAADSCTTDLTGFDLMLLGARFVGFDSGKNLYSGLEPTTPSYEGGVWYELVDEDKWRTMMDRVGQGLPPYASDADNPTAGIAG